MSALSKELISSVLHVVVGFNSRRVRTTRQVVRRPSVFGTSLAYIFSPANLPVDSLTVHEVCLDAPVRTMVLLRVVNDSEVME
ncbi:hypothetical protein [Thiohalophilus thiocyanatoxydans]|uniref:Uncharacterized protein n=1 Tax=Thiohalophilus thiocyanatoxydans TaxID=381308 RepID=A0A4R8IUC9_9GAMM|nr:hypothetical protein [Thiohalophilus thiocyanatoxydans]TDY04034.1 hypothetical protein EDC23_0405 [Thiohalophilus thiocyanatoxydans]